MSSVATAAPAAPTPAAATAATAARWTVVLAVVLTAVLEVLDSIIINVALPHMKAAFGITSDQTVWILTSYIVASIIVMPLTGLFARRFGWPAMRRCRRMTCWPSAGWHRAACPCGWRHWRGPAVTRSRTCLGRPT